MIIVVIMLFVRGMQGSGEETFGQGVTALLLLMSFAAAAAQQINIGCH